MENNYLKEQYYYSPDVPFFVDSLKSKEAKKAFFQRQEDLSTKVWLGTSRAKLKGDTREVESGAKWLAMSFEHHLKNGDIDGAAGRAKVITSPSGENIYIVMPVRTTKAFEEWDPDLLFQPDEREEEPHNIVIKACLSDQTPTAGKLIPMTFYRSLTDKALAVALTPVRNTVYEWMEWNNKGERKPKSALVRFLGMRVRPNIWGNIKDRDITRFAGYFNWLVENGIIWAGVLLPATIYKIHGSKDRAIFIFPVEKDGSICVGSLYGKQKQGFVGESEWPKKWDGMIPDSEIMLPPDPVALNRGGITNRIIRAKFENNPSPPNIVI